MTLNKKTLNYFTIGYLIYIYKQELNSNSSYLVTKKVQKNVNKDPKRGRNQKKTPRVGKMCRLFVTGNEYFSYIILTVSSEMMLNEDSIYYMEQILTSGSF